MVQSYPGLPDDRENRKEAVLSSYVSQERDWTYSDAERATAETLLDETNDKLIIRFAQLLVRNWLRKMEWGFPRAEAAKATAGKSQLPDSALPSAAEEVSLATAGESQLNSLSPEASDSLMGEKYLTHEVNLCSQHPVYMCYALR